jgi:hypothetical protein
MPARHLLNGERAQQGMLRVARSRSSLYYWIIKIRFQSTQSLTRTRRRGCLEEPMWERVAISPDFLEVDDFRVLLAFPALQEKNLLVVFSPGG